MIEDNFLEQILFGNTVRDYIISIGVILIGTLIMKLVSRVISYLVFRLFKRYAKDVTAEEFTHLLTKPVSTFFILSLAYISLVNLSFPPSWHLKPDDQFGFLMVLHKGYHIAIIFSACLIVLRIIDFIGLIMLRRAEKTISRTDDQLVPFLTDGVKIITTVLFFFFMLGTVFSVNVVTLIGGLGIGGLALALAGKETIENLFGSVTIFLDKPFIVGDQIKIENVQGNVEAIGLRSTKIRTLERSLVSVPNKKMINADVENITGRTFWRARFSIGVLYSTKAQDIQNIITEIKNYLDFHSEIDDSSLVTLEKFNDSSIDILIVFLVKTNEFEIFARVREQVNFRLIEIVENNNTSFAFPSRSIYMENTVTTSISQP